MSQRNPAPVIGPDDGPLTRLDRERSSGHPALCVWFTGLPAAGKSTLAHGLERRLHARGLRTSVLDGDDLRGGLCAGLGFSPADRSENLRRAGHAARLLVESGAIVCCAFVSPTTADRERVRALLDPGRFLEVWVRCTLAVCRARDPKGLYRRADRGELADLTGVGAPYEAPHAAELVVDTSDGDRLGPLALVEARVLAALAQIAETGLLARRPLEM